MKKNVGFRKKILIIIGLLLVIAGLILMFNSLQGITGRVITDNYNEQTSAFLGVVMFASGLGLLSMARKRKKGQAAMEFIMTYGWAILATLVAVAMLAYLGIFNGGSLYASPAQVQLSPPFTVSAATLGDGGDGLAMQLRNGGGNTKTINTITISGCGTASNVGSIQSGQTITVIVGCNPIVKKFVSNTITVVYTNPGSSLAQTSSGTVSGNPAPDTMPPIQSGWNPPSGSTVSGGFNIVFNLDEPATCEICDIDQGFVDCASFAVSCSGGGTTSSSCPVADPGTPFTRFINCVDLSGNMDTDITNTGLSYF